MRCKWMLAIMLVALLAPGSAEAQEVCREKADQMCYSGELHTQDWGCYTLDAVRPGKCKNVEDLPPLPLILMADTWVCGHNNEKRTIGSDDEDTPKPADTYCAGVDDAHHEWVWVPVPDPDRDDESTDPTVYDNCDAMWKEYPNGVGREGQHADVYAVNTRLDDDKDGWACERDTPPPPPTPPPTPTPTLGLLSVALDRLFDALFSLLP